MRKAWIRKLLKITGALFLILLVAFCIVVYRFISPKTDDQITSAFKGEQYQPFIDHVLFKGRNVRVIQMQSENDLDLPNLIFIHGSPGSSMDFKRYLMDEQLNEHSNIIAYDRIGYSDQETGEILPSVEQEVELLHQLLNGLNINNTVLVGYSYGGTVAMASPLDFKKKIALAAAVKGDLEPMFWAMNLYKWDLTRPLVPKVLRAATEEKLRHVSELEGYEGKWTISKSEVISVHGNTDFIVPYQNSLYLAGLLGRRFSLVTLEDGDHALIWTDFELIRDLLLKSLKE